MTPLEQAFTEFVNATIGDLIRQQVAEHIEILRGPPWVTKKEAAQLLGCSPRTLARHISLGRLTTSKPPDNRPLVERASIYALIEAWKEPRYSWERPWPRRPRGLGPHKSSAHAEAAKLGHERRRLREAGIHDEITMQVLAEHKKKVEARKARQKAKKDPEGS